MQEYTSPSERLKALTDQLEQGVSDIFQSGQYAAYLTAMSKFHHYSFGNIHLITTPGHGGIMAEWPAYLELSVAARKCGFRENGCLWFEEDCCEQVVLRELLDRGMWTLPDRISDPAKFEEGINRIIQQYHPDYWSEREAGRTVPQTRKVREKNNLSIRKGEQADKAI